MNVIKVTGTGPGEPAVRLVDSGGEPVAEVDGCLRLLAVRDYSPNTNFYKTELELGHCLRLPQEGPCECDLYLTCAKFVTTPQYAPRLRERLCLERQLADDARERGWERQVDRHERVAGRIRGLLSDLGEPGGMHADTP